MFKITKSEVTDIRSKAYVKALKAALYGLMYTAGWLTVDLLTPEPWGDYLLFGLMAVVNVAFGWKYVMLSQQKSNKLSAKKNENQHAIQYETKT